jgi:hypothetical protein
MFYLEKKDEFSGNGPYLKYGRKGKPITAVIDLCTKTSEASEGINGVHVIKDQSSKRKFKIFTEEV